MTETMRALVKHGNALDTVFDDVPVPLRGPDELLIRVLGCGLCGSDVHAWRDDAGYEWVKTPVVLGHEVFGEIVEHPQDDARYHVGQLVVPISIPGCDAPRWRARNPEARRDPKVLGMTYDGGLAQYVTVSVDEVVVLPPGLPAEVGTLTEPLSVSVHALSRLPQLEAGDIVGVCGPGPVGLLAAWALQHQGIRVFLVGAERDRDYRLVQASRLGIETFVSGQPEIPIADYWIEASGSAEGMTASMSRTRPGGRIVSVAMYAHQPVIDFNVLVRGEIEIVGSYGSMRRDYERAVSLLSGAQQLGEIFVTKYPLAGALEALEATAASRVVKAVVVP